MKNKKTYNRARKPESNAGYILDGLYSDCLRNTLEDRIRAWVILDDDRDGKDRALRAIYDEQVREKTTASPEALERLNEIKRRLGLPESQYPVENGRVIIPAVSDNAPSVQKAAGRHGGTVPLRRRITIGAAAVLIPALLIAGAVGLFRTFRTARPGDPAAQEIAVAADSVRRSVLLADGTAVTLYPGAEITYPDAFGDERRVNLTGKAFLKVARDETKKFTVAADGLTITVHGTEFMVTAHRGADRSAVTLHSGSVEVQAGDTVAVLAPRQQFMFSNSTGKVSIEEVEPEDWTKPNMDFYMRPLSEILASIAEYYRITIEKEGAPGALATRYKIDLTGCADAATAMRLLAGTTRTFSFTEDGDTIRIKTNER